jgi:hypothetical protein
LGRDVEDLVVKGDRAEMEANNVIAIVRFSWL